VGISLRSRLPRVCVDRVWRTHLFLSEHRGDAPPATLLAVGIGDVDAVEAEFCRPDGVPPYKCEFELRDPDGNRLRISRLAS
jgi:hypothetical protein